MNNFVLDVNVILDMLLSRGDTSAIDQIMDAAKAGNVRCWVSTCSLPIIEYVAISVLKKESVEPKEAKNLTRQLLTVLLDDVNTLCAYQTEHVEEMLASRDMEDAQIALAASTLPEPVYILTRDKTFDTRDRVTCLTPEQALTKLTS